MHAVGAIDHFTWAVAATAPSNGLPDNVRLHWREWPGPADADARPAILCLPGLTRNVRDFEALGQRLSARFRVVAASLRGRGESGYARDKLSYVPLQYLHDLGTVIADARLHRFVVIGTSLGGLLGLMLPMTHRAQMAGVVLNDLGPVLEPDGIARVREQVRRRADGWPSWLVAARDIARRQGAIHPDFTLDDWLAHAKRLCRVSKEGRILFDYDPEIAAPMDLPNSDQTMDLWAAFDALRDMPVLSIRGERSDILSPETQAKMAARHRDCMIVTVPRVGHAPLLSEPQAVAAIDACLARVGA